MDVEDRKPDLKENAKFASQDHPYALIHKVYSEEAVRKRLDALAEHRPGKMPYHCAACGLNFFLLGQLRSHIATIHPGSSECPLCGQSVRSVKNLKYHLRRCIAKNQSSPRVKIQHNNSKRVSNKTFKCSLCDAGFSDHRVAMQHIYTHFSQRPFACKICGYSFISEGECNAHERSHENVNEKERHICNICGQSFCEFIQLQKHFSTHTKMVETEEDDTNQGGQNNENEIDRATPETIDRATPETIYRATPLTYKYRCGECNTGFTTIPELRKHFQVHIHLYTNTIFKCDICFKKFGVKRNYKHHMAIHSGDYPIICSKCGKGFFYEGCYLTHNKAYHKTEECDGTRNVITGDSDISS